MKLISTTKILQTRKCPMTRFQSLPLKNFSISLWERSHLSHHIVRPESYKKAAKRFKLTLPVQIRHHSHGKGKIPHSSGHIPGVCLGRGCLCFHLVILVNLVSPFHYLHSYFNRWIGSFGSCDSGDSRDFRVAHELLSYQLISGLI